MATDTDLEIKLTGHKFRVNFMCTNPLTGDLHFAGDVVVIPEALITPAQTKDGLYTRLPDDVPTNRIPRDREEIVGVTISEDAYNAQMALTALNSKVAPGFSEAAKVSGNTAPRR